MTSTDANVIAGVVLGLVTLAICVSVIGAPDDAVGDRRPLVSPTR